LWYSDYSLGLVWAAAIVAIADFVLVVIVVLVARNSEPGPEIELALDVRKMAIDAIQADARDLKVTDAWLDRSRNG
jgi:hypothetical protein